MNRLALIGAIALPILATACSDTPVAPQVRPQFATDGGLGKVAKYKNGGPQSAKFASQTIGTEGGTISLGAFAVEVPPGAVSAPTTFTINLPSDSKRWSYVIAEFGPHGIQFAVPVTLTLPYSGTTSEGDATIHVLWNSGTDWVALPSWLTRDGRIQTQTNHFSEYGTEETNRGITAAGG
jgi:hypothetical protein